MKVTVDGGKVQVVREIDNGLETVELTTPVRPRVPPVEMDALQAVITADLRLNEPRDASLPNIMKAKKKPIETVTPESLGVDVAPHLGATAHARPRRSAGTDVVSFEGPKARVGGKKVESVQELLDKLRTEAKVL